MIFQMLPKTDHRNAYLAISKFQTKSAIFPVYFAQNTLYVRQEHHGLGFPDSV